jgi:hypothetical protein
MECNNNVYCRLSKILCGFKDQVRARPSGETGGLRPAPAPVILVRNAGIILLTTGKSLTASTTSGTWTCFREKPYVPENRIHHHDHDDEEQYCDDVARFRDGGHGYEQ